MINKIFKLFAITLVYISLPHTTTASDTPSPDSPSPDGPDDFMSLSLEELLELDIISSSLTQIKNNLSSSSVTLITSRDIAVSGARSMDELLEIYVPSFMMLYKGKSSHSIGARGILNDRNDKVLMLVNGKIMNARHSIGVYSERFLSMLGDIDRIEVIESPQSSLYGPGGISMIVNIFTKNAENTSTNNEVTLNQGGIDRYSNLQLRHANKVNEKFSYSAYYGADRQPGASQRHSPLKFSFQDTIRSTQEAIRPDQAIDFPLANLNESNQELRHKANVEAKYGDFSAWVRYTNAGYSFIQNQQNILTRRNQEVLSYGSLSYNHLTSFVNHNTSLNKNISLDTRVSYDKLSTERINIGPDIERDVEESEIYARSILTYNLNRFSIAAGPAVSFEKFNDQLPEGEEWRTFTYSGIGEVQFFPLENLSILVGTRVDKHTYTDALWSPRAVATWRPFTDHLVRFQYSRSNRRADDGDLRTAELEGAGGNDNEVVNFYELSGELKIANKLSLKPNVFYSDYDLITWNAGLGRTSPLGKLRYAGAGLSLIHKNNKHFISASHQYTRVISLNLSDSTVDRSHISPEPFGYGNSFHNFPDHLTKLVYQYTINEHMNISSSAQINWGMKGAENGARYNEDELGPIRNFAIYGSGNAYKPSVYMHLGFVYTDLIPNLSVSVFGHNILGLIDEDLNKRGEFFRNSMYRIQPASFTVRVGYSF